MLQRLQGLLKTNINWSRIRTSRLPGQHRRDGAAGADNDEWTPEHESVRGNTPSGTYNTLVELDDPQHEHHHQADTEDATAPGNEATTLTPTTPDLSKSSAALRMKALYGFLATLDGVLLHFACENEHDGDSHSSSGTLPSPLPPECYVTSACRQLFVAGIVTTALGLLISSVLAVFMQSQDAVVRLLGQRFAGAAKKNRCRMTLYSGPNSLTKYLLAWFTVLPSGCGFVFLMLVRFWGA